MMTKICEQIPLLLSNNGNIRQWPNNVFCMKMKSDATKLETIDHFVMSLIERKLLSSECVNLFRMFLIISPLTLSHSLNLAQEG